MNERERTALAEAIENCASHNREYQHVTPMAKIAEWRHVLGEAVRAPTDLYPARIAEALKSNPVLIKELREAHGLRVAPFGAPMAVGDADFPAAVDFARRVEQELDAAKKSDAAELASLRVGTLAHAVAVLAGAPL